jgi:hypothetical protein
MNYALFNIIIFPLQLVHYEQKLNQDWASKYEADSGKCLECGGSDNIVPGAEMGEEGKSSFVRHMALDHDKVNITFDDLSEVYLKLF